jgi:hypothetical protein
MRFLGERGNHPIASTQPELFQNAEGIRSIGEK